MLATTLPWPWPPPCQHGHKLTPTGDCQQHRRVETRVELDVLLRPTLRDWRHLRWPRQDC
eukprot:1206690-Lingulodinium_polyedra.AAC.1